jgi:MFS family permease
VTAVGSKVSRGVALLASLILTCSGVYLAFTSWGPWMFAASVLLWTCGTNIFTPYAYGATAAADPTGSSTALASAVSGAGFALGPLLAVPFIEAGGIGGVRWLAWPFLVAGFIAFAMLLQRLRVTSPRSLMSPDA